MNLSVLFDLAAVLVPLSLLAIGGLFTIVPEIHRQSVIVYGWVTDPEFIQYFALAQASPGPNILVVSLIGWKIAGLAGGLVATLAICIPSSLLALLVAHIWRRPGNSPWRLAVQAGLAPPAIGLTLSSALLLSNVAASSWLFYAVAFATAIILVRTRIHPLLLMGIAACLAIPGWL
jgi:chromate transporter